MKGEKNRAEENKTANYSLGLFSRDGENKTGNYMREKIGWTWQWTNRGRFDRQKKFLVLGAEFVSSETEKFSRRRKIFSSTTKCIFLTEKKDYENTANYKKY